MLPHGAHLHHQPRALRGAGASSGPGHHQHRLRAVHSIGSCHLQRESQECGKSGAAWTSVAWCCLLAACQPPAWRGGVAGEGRAVLRGAAAGWRGPGHETPRRLGRTCSRPRRPTSPRPGKTAKMLPTACGAYACSERPSSCIAGGSAAAIGRPEASRWSRSCWVRASSTDAGGHPAVACSTRWLTQLAPIMEEPSRGSHATL